MIPTNFILDLRDELLEFKGVVCEMDMPTVDLDAALSQILDALTNLQLADDCLMDVANGQAFGDWLFENAELAEDGRGRIYAAVFRLGEAIKNKLQYHHAYSPNTGALPYEFRRFIDRESILLIQSPQAGVGF